MPKMFQALLPQLFLHLLSVANKPATNTAFQELLNVAGCSNMDIWSATRFVCVVELPSPISRNKNQEELGTGRGKEAGATRARQEVEIVQQLFVRRSEVSNPNPNPNPFPISFHFLSTISQPTNQPTTSTNNPHVQQALYSPLFIALSPECAMYKPA